MSSISLDRAEGYNVSTAQREIAELEEYIKNNGNDFKTKALVANPNGETVESNRAKKSARLEQQIQISEEKRDEVKNKSSVNRSAEGVEMEISETGRLRAENATRESILLKINSNAKEAKVYPEYEEAFEKESVGFKKAYATQTIGKYVDSGIKKDEVDLSYVEKLNALYDKLREEIKGVGDPEEQTARMKSLDDSYQRVFEKNIIKPLKSQYDGQASFYESGTTRKDSQMISSYQGLKDSRSVVDALMNNDNWHDTDSMKTLIEKLTDAVVTNAASK
ncbi:MAG: hypothetical protein K6F30_08135 [Lachnospiraceae bacterium]|nr:hypothetical protein [Lachnospiraceae bacterium]